MQLKSVFKYIVNLLTCKIFNVGTSREYILLLADELSGLRVN